MTLEKRWQAQLNERAREIVERRVALAAREAAIDRACQWGAPKLDHESDPPDPRVEGLIRLLREVARREEEMLEFESTVRRAYALTYPEAGLSRSRRLFGALGRALLAAARVLARWGERLDERQAE